MRRLDAEGERQEEVRGSVHLDLFSTNASRRVVFFVSFSATNKAIRSEKYEIVLFLFKKINKGGL